MTRGISWRPLVVSITSRTLWRTRPSPERCGAACNQSPGRAARVEKVAAAAVACVASSNLLLLLSAPSLLLTHAMVLKNSFFNCAHSSILLCDLLSTAPLVKEIVEPTICSLATTTLPCAAPSKIRLRCASDTAGSTGFIHASLSGLRGAGTSLGAYVFVQRRERHPHVCQPMASKHYCSRRVGPRRIHYFRLRCGRRRI